MILHAGLIAAHGPQGWRGVLIEGPSGAGKSDLALRAAALGFRLVADDRTLVWTSGGALYGRAPDTLSGLIEARGVGVLRAPVLPFCRIALVARAGTPDRIPDPASAEYLGLQVPVLLLQLLESSAPHKVLSALQHLGA